MIDFNSLFKVTYGLYIVCSGNENTGNGYVSNTFFQVTSEPPKFASCCNKKNFTSEIIEKTGFFSVSVLHQKAGSETFGRFGYRSGRDFNKMEGMRIKYGQSGVPIILNDSIAYLECKVVQKIDAGTHWLFIGELMSAQILDETIDPMTYAYYHQVRKGMAPKNAPTYIDQAKLKAQEEPAKPKIFKCTICGHIYDEAKEKIPFADLPANWKCPVCGAAKKEFIEVK